MLYKRESICYNMDIETRKQKEKENKTMKVMYMINNYQLGSRMRMTPVDKIVEKQRIDKSHTKVVYEITEREKQFTDKCYAKTGKVI